MLSFISTPSVFRLLLVSLSLSLSQLTPLGMEIRAPAPVPCCVASASGRINVIFRCGAKIAGAGSLRERRGPTAEACSNLLCPFFYLLCARRERRLLPKILRGTLVSLVCVHRNSFESETRAAIQGLLKRSECARDVCANFAPAKYSPAACKCPAAAAAAASSYTGKRWECGALCVCQDHIC